MPAARALVPGPLRVLGQDGLVPAAGEPAPGLAFWIHQVVEYLLGILVISQAAQTSRPVLPVLVGLAIIVLAATADGPVAAFHVVSRPVHRFLDIGMIAVIVLVIVFERDAMDTTGLLFIGLAAVTMVGLVVRTNYRRKSRASRSSFAAGAASVDPVAGGSSSASKSESYGRAAGRVVGLGVRGLRNRKTPPAAPPPPPPSGSGS